MYPAERMLTDGELTGIVADNHRVAQKLMSLDAAPERPLGSDLHRVGRDGERSDAEPLKVCSPRRCVGKLLVWVRRETGDRRASKRAPTHISDSGIVNRVIGVSGTQQIEEV